MRQKLRNRNKYVRFISHEKCKILSIFPTFFKTLSNFVQIECLARYTFFPFISLISMEDNHPCRKHEYKYAIFPSLIFTMVERVRGKYRKKMQTGISPVTVLPSLPNSIGFIELRELPWTAFINHEYLRDLIFHVL